MIRCTGENGIARLRVGEKIIAIGGIKIEAANGFPRSFPGGKGIYDCEETLPERRVKAMMESTRCFIGGEFKFLYE
jgi:hypothetical protein